MDRHAIINVVDFAKNPFRQGESTSRISRVIPVIRDL
jgi:hypothetical protein